MSDRLFNCNNCGVVLTDSAIFIDLMPSFRKVAKEHPAVNVCEDGSIELKPGYENARIEVE